MNQTPRTKKGLIQRRTCIFPQNISKLDSQCVRIDCLSPCQPGPKCLTLQAKTCSFSNRLWVRALYRISLIQTLFLVHFNLDTFFFFYNARKLYYFVKMFRYSVVVLRITWISFVFWLFLISLKYQICKVENVIIKSRYFWSLSATTP